MNASSYSTSGPGDDEWKRVLFQHLTQLSQHSVSSSPEEVARLATTIVREILEHQTDLYESAEWAWFEDLVDRLSETDHLSEEALQAAEIVANLLSEKPTRAVPTPEEILSSPRFDFELDRELGVFVIDQIDQARYPIQDILNLIDWSTYCAPPALTDLCKKELPLDGPSLLFNEEFAGLAHDGVTHGEYHAMAHYTNPEEMTFENMNKLLRHGKLPEDDFSPPDKTSARKTVLCILGTASFLNKARSLSHKGTVIRTTSRINPRVLKTYRAGALVKEPGFTSSSKGVVYSEGREVYYLIHSKTGKYIAEHSLAPGESEVLFAPGTTFEVLDKPRMREGKLVITMQEV